MLGGKFLRGRQPIGLDVGSHSIRMLQLRHVQNGWAPVAAAHTEIPGDIPTDRTERTTALAKLIRGLLDEGSFQGRQVVSCLPAGSLQYKNLRLPAMPDDELRAAVAWEAKDRLLLGGDGGQVQYFDAGDVRQGEDLRREVILMGAPPGLVDEHVHVIQKCGLIPAAVDAVPGALARCITSRRTEDLNDQADMAIDIGHTCSKVLITRNGRVLFFKLIEIGGRVFDEAVAEWLGISPGIASRVRQSCAGRGGVGIPDDGSVDPVSAKDAVVDAIKRPVEQLANEINLCLRYFNVTFRGSRPGVARVFGGQAHDPILVRTLGDNLSFELDANAPVTGLDLGAVSKESGTGMGIGKWAVAVGLSMRQIHGNAKRGAA